MYIRVYKWREQASGLPPPKGGGNGGKVWADSIVFLKKLQDTEPFAQHFRRRPIDVVYVGKAATALLMFGFCDLLLGLPVVDGLGLVSAAWLPGLNSQASALGIFFVYAGVACSLVTAVVYTFKGVQVIRDSRRSGASA